MEKSLPQNPILTPEIFSSVVFGQVTKLFWVCIPNSKMPERVEFSFEKQKRKKEKKRNTFRRPYAQSHKIQVPVNPESPSHWLDSSYRGTGKKKKRWPDFSKDFTGQLIQMNTLMWMYRVEENAVKAEVRTKRK